MSLFCTHFFLVGLKKRVIQLGATNTKTREPRNASACRDLAGQIAQDRKLLVLLVEMRGFEPPTCTLRTYRSPN